MLEQAHALEQRAQALDGYASGLSTRERAKLRELPSQEPEWRAALVASVELPSSPPAEAQVWPQGGDEHAQYAYKVEAEYAGCSPGMQRGVVSPQGRWECSCGYLNPATETACRMCHDQRTPPYLPSTGTREHLKT